MDDQVRNLIGRFAGVVPDGPPLRKNPDPTFWGTPMGHWEGQTLVAETVRLLPDTNVIPGSRTAALHASGCLGVAA